MIKKFLSEKTVSFYLRLAAIVLAFVPIIYMATRITIEKDYIWAIVFGAVGIGSHIAALILDKKSWADYLELAGTFCLAGELAMFAVGGCLSVVDYVYGINFWGDATQFPAIIGFGVVLLVGAVISVVTCFLKKAYEKEQV